jgi:hypothetical protein
VAEEGGRRPTAVSALELQARILIELGRPAEALSLANTGIQMTNDMGARSILWRIRAAKAQALEILGDAEAAAKEHQAATEILYDLARTIPDDALRQGFLTDALVSTIIAGSGTTLKEKGV